MTEDEDPYAEAACIDADPDLFFPKPAGIGETSDIYAEGREFCAVCPIRQRCADDHRHERHGLWGGTTPVDRGFVKSKRQTKTQTQVRAWILRHNGHELTTAQIASATGCHRNTVLSVLRSMVADGSVVKVGATYRPTQGLVVA